MDESRAEAISIARRFHGPPGSANGGYTAGLLAGAFAVDHRDHRDHTDPSRRALEVTLRRPPPLDTAMEVRREAQTTSLVLGDRVVAEARAGQVSAEPVESVSMGDARHAETLYAGLVSHPFPTCFTCGPERAAGDGLRLFPGRLGDGRTACTWRPHEALADPGDARTVRPEMVWASLDCPGGWTADLQGRPMVLGRITAQVDATAHVGEPHVVMGRLLGEEGRKTFTTTTLYDSDGRIVARAEHIWFAVDPREFS